MRYYEVYLPGESTPRITSNARRLRNLPTGTRCTVCITEADGTPSEFYDIPVVDGRVQFRDRTGMRNPQMTR